MDEDVGLMEDENGGVMEDDAYKESLKSCRQTM